MQQKRDPGREQKRAPKREPQKMQMREQSQEEEKNTSIIIGRNPVLEALAAGRTIEKLIIGKGAEGSVKKILGIAKDRGITVTFAEKNTLDRIAGSGVHQGVAAYVSAHEYSELEDLFQAAMQSGEDPFFVILDGIEDPHNLGAVLRTADAAGAHGVIIPKRRSAGLTETVAKASAGAIEYVPVVKVTNIAQTIDTLKERGLWIAACDMGDNIYCKTNLKGPLAIVIGSEGFGIGKLIKEKCDFVVSIPMKGRITSLNASNAAAILLYEVRRQRDNI